MGHNAREKNKPISLATAVNPLPQWQAAVLQAADELRQRIAERIGGRLDCSSRYVRKDRER